MALVSYALTSIGTQAGALMRALAKDNAPNISVMVTEATHRNQSRSYSSIACKLLSAGFGILVIGPEDSHETPQKAQ